MSHGGQPGRKQLYLLGGALLLGVIIYLTVPGSLTYLLIGLFIVLHFGMHGAHGHGAHGHGAHGHGDREREDPAVAQSPDPGRDPTLAIVVPPNHPAYAMHATVAARTAARVNPDVAAGAASAADEPDANPRQRQADEGHGRHRCC